MHTTSTVCSHEANSPVGHSGLWKCGRIQRATARTTHAADQSSRNGLPIFPQKIVRGQFFRIFRLINRVILIPGPEGGSPRRPTKLPDGRHFVEAPMRHIGVPSLLWRSRSPPPWLYAPLPGSAAGAGRGAEVRPDRGRAGLQRHRPPSNLKYADNDGNELAALLRQQGYRRVVLMTRSEALKQGPRRTRPQGRRHPRPAQKRRSVLEDCREGDTVVVAFSGHGEQVEQRRQVLLLPAQRPTWATQRRWSRWTRCTPSLKVAKPTWATQRRSSRWTMYPSSRGAGRASSCWWRTPVAATRFAVGKAAGDPRLKDGDSCPFWKKPEGGAMAIV